MYICWSARSLFLGQSPFFTSIVYYSNDNWPGLDVFDIDSCALHKHNLNSLWWQLCICCLQFVILSLLEWALSLFCNRLLMPLVIDIRVRFMPWFDQCWSRRIKLPKCKLIALKAQSVCLNYIADIISLNRSCIYNHNNSNCIGNTFTTLQKLFGVGGGGGLRDICFSVYRSFGVRFAYHRALFLVQPQPYQHKSHQSILEMKHSITDCMLPHKTILV